MIQGEFGDNHTEFFPNGGESDFASLKSSHTKIQLPRHTIP
uniref:Uncharacterized protein n=1 Tax=Anguilla anguilla TaxID=7936 RepID=A0A0E9T6L7_ANGAN